MKTSSLGDVVHHCPAVSDAARALPGAEMDWVVEETFAPVAAMHPAVRRVIPVAIRRWRNELWRPAMWAELRAFRRALRAERYDAVIDSQGLLKSAVVASMAHGTLHGLDAASAREATAARFYKRAHAVAKGLHAVERNRQLTALALGYALNHVIDYGLHADRRQPSEKAPYAVFLTMTSRADKLWPEAHWIALGRALDVPVILPWGSETERLRAQRVAEGIGTATVPARMELAALAALFTGAKALAGLDSGLTHLAAALGVRTVGIYCGSDPALTGLYGAPNAANVGAAGRVPEAAEVLERLR